MRLPRMTTRRWMIVIVATALDLAVIIHGPPAWAFSAFALAVVAPVFGAVVVLIRWGNEGPGKTLY